MYQLVIYSFFIILTTLTISVISSVCSTNFLYHGASPIKVGTSPPVNIYLIFYTQYKSDYTTSNTPSVLRTFCQYFGSSSYANIFTYYNVTNQFKYQGVTQIVAPASTLTVTDSTVGSVLSSAISSSFSSTYDNNGIYVVVFNGNFHYQSSKNGNKKWGADWCSFAGNFTVNGRNLLAIPIGDASFLNTSTTYNNNVRAKCGGGNSGPYGAQNFGSPNKNVFADSIVATLSVTLFNSLTSWNRTGWYSTCSSINYKIGDMCINQYGTPILDSVSGGHYNTILGGVKFLLQQIWINKRPTAVCGLTAQSVLHVPTATPVLYPSVSPSTQPTIVNIYSSAVPSPGVETPSPSTLYPTVGASAASLFAIPYANFQMPVYASVLVLIGIGIALSCVIHMILTILYPPKPLLDLARKSVTGSRANSRANSRAGSRAGSRSNSRAGSRSSSRRDVETGNTVSNTPRGSRNNSRADIEEIIGPPKTPRSPATPARSISRAGSNVDVDGYRTPGAGGSRPPSRVNSHAGDIPVVEAIPIDNYGNAMVPTSNATPRHSYTSGPVSPASPTTPAGRSVHSASNASNMSNTMTPHRPSRPPSGLVSPAVMIEALATLPKSQQAAFAETMGLSATQLDAYLALVATIPKDVLNNIADRETSALETHIVNGGDVTSMTKPRSNSGDTNAATGKKKSRPSTPTSTGLRTPPGGSTPASPATSEADIARRRMQAAIAEEQKSDTDRTVLQKQRRPSLTPSGKKKPKPFDVTFVDQKLGCQLGKNKQTNTSFVNKVAEGSAADALGVLPGDEVIAVDGQVMKTHDDVLYYLQSAGRPVTIRFLRAN